MLEKVATMNRLSNEKSPYLVQHMENPVDWFPWGEEAFSKAKAEKKPVFLSIGYATCHWCHVMAHESFEDKGVAEVLNKHFVSIKVDREERPDIDNIYMSVCQAMTGSGGWPLTVFLTPEAKPFYAGTYFPRTGRMGMIGFVEILDQIAKLWEREPERIMDAGHNVTNQIRQAAIMNEKFSLPGKEILEKGYGQLKSGFDPQNGGFSPAPKFPTPHQLTFLLRWYHRNGDPHALEMVVKTLTSMRRGGVFDQIGFGFHRYSVDGEWLVPHFEKMLYDQALIAMAYIEAYQVTEKDLFAETAEKIISYVMRDMTDPEGGFYSAEDADSEGREGVFYVWKPDEIKSLLGNKTGGLVCRFYGIDQEGNFEDGFSIAHEPHLPEPFAKTEDIPVVELEKVLEDARIKLLNARKNRIHPLKDDKILTAWNGLMIATLAKASRAFENIAYAAAAERAAQFILERLVAKDGRILRRFRKGEAAFPGYLEDYAFFIWGLLELYEATFEVLWLEHAVRLNQAMIHIFWDTEGGGLYFTGKGNESLIMRTKDAYDGAIPSGNSVAAMNLMRLFRMTNDPDLKNRAETLIKSIAAQINQYPAGYTQSLSAIDFMTGPCKEIVISGDAENAVTQEMLKIINSGFRPYQVVLFQKSGDEGSRLISLIPFLANMRGINDEPTVFVCENYACQSPILDPDELREHLK